MENNKQPQEKTCKKCKYFLQHYIKHNTRFDTVCCGHCTNKNIKKFKPKYNEECEFWEDNAIIIEERKQSINETIEFMCDRLHQIALILEDDI